MRNLEPFNAIGFSSLYRSEIKRFIKDPIDSIFTSPLLCLLYLGLFVIIFEGMNKSYFGINYISFLFPGLIMMVIMQTSYENNAYSILTLKNQGNIADYIVAPINNFEFITAFLLAGLTRGIICGHASFFALYLCFHLSPVSYLIIFVFIFLSSLMASLIGLIVGLWAEKWEQEQTFYHLAIVPLTFLCGTFYSINQFPDLVSRIIKWNPFFCGIDGFRYGFIEYTDSNYIFDFFVLLFFNFLLLVLCFFLFHKGYGLKK